MKTHIMDRHLWKHTGGKKNPEHAQGDEAEAAVNPLTSTVLVLIKTRCRENDCREERNTQSDTHMHAHTHTRIPWCNSLQNTTTTGCNIRGVDTC